MGKINEYQSTDKDIISNEKECMSISARLRPPVDQISLRQNWSNFKKYILNESLFTYLFRISGFQSISSISQTDQLVF